MDGRGESLAGVVEDVNIFGLKTPLVFGIDTGPGENKFTDNRCSKGGFV